MKNITITIRIPRHIHKHIKIAATKKGVTNSCVVEAAVRQYLKLKERAA